MLGMAVGGAIPAPSGTSGAVGSRSTNAGTNNANSNGGLNKDQVKNCVCFKLCIFV